MIIVDIRRLLKKLSPASTTALQEAVARTVNREHPEVTPVHLVLALLDDAKCDFSVALAMQGVDRAALRRAALGAEAGLPGKHKGKPVFSPSTIELLQDAWLAGSVHQDYTTVRSGMILWAIRRTPARYELAALEHHLRPSADAAPDSGDLARIIATSDEARSQPPPPRAAPSSLPGQREEVLYRVCPGDTLLGIARELALDVAQVAEQNRLRINEVLTPGSFLRLRVLREIIDQKPAATRRDLS